MKVLYITQFYPPEIGAAANRSFETAEILSKDGFEVTVLTAFPNYLLNELPPKYRNRKRAVDEYRDGIHVKRTYIYFNRNPRSLAKRVITFLTFMMSSLCYGVRLKGYDAIFATSPPLSVGLTAYILSRLKGIPYIFEIRDLYPESATQLGVIKNPIIIDITQHFARFLYRNAFHLIAVTEGIRRHLEGVVTTQRISLLTTGVDLSLFKPLKPDENIVEAFRMRDTYTVLFLGIFGRMHALTVILDAAELLKDEAEIRFTFIGEGVQRKFLIAEAKRRHLKHVRFFPPQAREIVPHIINACDVCIDSRVKIGLSEGTIPVKVVEYLACGKPAIIGITGETVEIIRQSNGGLVVEPENGQALAEAILLLFRDRKLGEKLGKSGNKYVKQHFNRAKLVGRLETVLHKVASKDGLQNTTFKSSSSPLPP